MTDTLRDHQSRAGSVRTAAKTAASRANIARSPANKRKPLPPCTCGGGDKHRSACPVYRVLYSRRRREAAVMKGGE